MSEPERTRELPNRDRWLLLALVLSPLSVLWNQAVSYTLVPTACEHASKVMLHASALLFFLLSLSGALIGRRYRFPETAESEDIHERVRWMSLVVTILSIGCAMAIVAMEIPNVILRSCD